MTRSDPANPRQSIHCVSVLLAVRNDAALLRRCFAALAAQDYPSDRMEVIVADGDSSDDIVALVRAFAQAAPFSIRLVQNRRRSAAAGFNAGLRVARGTVIVILGARAVPAPSFLSRSVEALQSSGAAAAGGVVSAAASGLEAETVALALRSPFGVGDARYRFSLTAGHVDTLNYGAYRREVFAEAGGFDEAMDNVEDDEFNYRLRARGKRLYLSPEIRCGYVARPRLASLARQFARYGYPKVRVLRRHPRQMRPRQFVPAALVAALICGLAGYRYFRVARGLFWTALGSYAVSNAAASAWIARRDGWRFLPLLPLAFAGMHFGYGAASLAGVLRFLVWTALRRRQEPAEVPFFGPCWACAAEDTFSPCAPEAGA